MAIFRILESNREIAFLQRQQVGLLQQQLGGPQQPPPRRRLRADAAGRRRRQHPDALRHVPRRRARRALALRDGARRRPRTSSARRCATCSSCAASASPTSSASIVSSTVPQLEPEWMSMAQRYLGHRMLAVGPGLKTGMAIRIDNPRELGADRLVNAVAAHARLGGPCISVDFGTAVNYDVVSAEGEYLGGVIAPGRRDLARRAHLARRQAAAHRPRRAALGDRQGHGRRDPLRHRLRLRRAGRRHHRAASATSSARRRRRSRPAAWPRTIVPSTTTIDEVDDLLTLTGLRLLYEHNV